MGRTFHLCVDIEGALQNAKRLGVKYLDGMVSNNGKPLSGNDVARYLVKYRNQTGKQYFCGCDCQDEDGRCAGHAESDHNKRPNNE